MKILQINIILLFLTFSTGTWANTYKCVDNEGNITYSQYLYEEGNCTYVRTPKGGSQPSPTAKEQRKAAQDVIEQGTQEKAEQSKLDAEVAKNNELRKSNCKASKKHLQDYQIYRRFRDKDGNVRRVSDDERAKNIQLAKDNIKQFCD